MLDLRSEKHTDVSTFIFLFTEYLQKHTFLMIPQMLSHTCDKAA